MNRNHKPVIATPTSPRSGYSTVAEKRTINGIVKEVWPPAESEGGPAGGVAGMEGGGGGGGGEAAQLTSMMESWEARLKTISMTQQSTEISK